MENASKALIIAGAILLAILIIGLGMSVFTGARSTVQSANLDKEAIEAFNSQFETYTGDSVKGSKVKSLCDLVRNNNLVADDNTTFAVDLNYGGSSTLETDKNTNAQKINEAKNKIKSGSLYSVKAEYDTNSGLIKSLTITEK